MPPPGLGRLGACEMREVFCTLLGIPKINLIQHWLAKKKTVLPFQSHKALPWLPGHHEITWCLDVIAGFSLEERGHSLWLFRTPHSFSWETEGWEPPQEKEQGAQNHQLSSRENLEVTTLHHKHMFCLQVRPPQQKEQGAQSLQSLYN